MFDQNGQSWGRRAGKPPCAAQGPPTVLTVPWLADAARALYPELSPKERAVILAAARGAEDKEIAADFRCTVSTVRTLWQRSYKKTHTSSRRRVIAALWDKACQLAACHFLNDVTVPLESVKVIGIEPLAVRDSRDQQVKQR
jgi:DNA-binding CsgD family transcriptional regulator